MNLCDKSCTELITESVTGGQVTGVEINNYFTQQSIFYDYLKCQRAYMQISQI